MTLDLEQLVRDTLTDRAATVADGPRWIRPLGAGRPPRAGRSNRWRAPVAAAAAVLLVTGGAATWRSVRTRPGVAATTRACARLPQAWLDALATTSSVVPGVLDQVGTASLAPAVDERLAGLEFSVGHGSVEGGLTLPPPLDSLPELYHVSARHSLEIVPPGPGAHRPKAIVTWASVSSPSHASVQIVLLPGRTPPGLGALTLRPAGVPARWVLSPGGAAFRAGVVYWAVAPNRTNPDQAMVISYTVATGKYRIVARTDGAPDLFSDARGVSWRGGRVAAAGVPSAVPPLGESTYVQSDGTAFAWIDPAQPHIVHWADRAGRSHHYRVALPGDPSAAMVTPVVSGPFVFLTWKTAGPPRTYVLDARTGALADIDTAGGANARQTAVYSAKGLTAFTFGLRDGAIQVRTARTGSLPDLRC